jgi:HisJ family histidinol phosphate phosphatase
MSSPALAYDLHVHTRYSSDSTAELEAYASAGEQHCCHVGFLDHFELAFTGRPGYLREDRLPSLLEEFDRVHAVYPKTSLSLEVDYYTELATEVAEFCDHYHKDFDYLIGSIHTIDQLAVTVPAEFSALVKRFGLLGTVKRYFDEVEAAIRANLFDGIAHIDGVMRYVTVYPNICQAETFWQVRTRELGHLCRQQGLLVEVNLGGLRQPWGRTHPSSETIDELIAAGTHFYPSSDSHSVATFIEAIPLCRKMTDYLFAKDALRLPGKLGSG